MTLGEERCWTASTEETRIFSGERITKRELAEKNANAKEVWKRLVMRTPFVRFV